MAGIVRRERDAGQWSLFEEVCVLLLLARRGVFARHAHKTVQVFCEDPLPLCLQLA